MAGCNCTKELYKVTYDDAVKTETAKHNDWSPTQVRLEVAKIFRPQYHQNEASRRDELSGKPEYDGTKFSFDTNQGVRFINGEGSVGLLELHERQLRLTPEKYSEDEHNVSILINETFRNGANEVVTSYPSSDGQRDIVVMKLDRKTGKGTMRIINTQADHTESEIKSISKEAFGHLSEISAGRAFILSDKPLTEKVVHQTLETVHYAGRQTVREVGQTITSVRRYIENRKELNGQMPKREQIIPLALNPEKRTIFEVIKEKILPIKKMKQQIVSGKAGLLRMKRTFSSDRGSVPMIAFASEKKFKKILVVPEMNKSIARHERKVQKAKARLEAKQKTLIPKELFVKTRKEKRPGVFLEEKFALKKRIKQKEPLAVKLKKEKVKIERIVIERVVRLLTLVRKFIQKKEKIVGLKTKKVEIKKVQEYVLDFSIATIFLFLLTKPNNVLTNEYKKSNKLDTLITKKQTPWLLLAIIWHLAMIREMGVAPAVTQTKQKKTKKTIYYPRFAPQGVIFAYAT